jgi:hypothetical protein
MKITSIGLTALLIGTALPASAQQKREITPRGGSDRVTIETKDNQTVGKFVSEGYQSERVLQDLDGDGWCDIWCSIFQREKENLSRRVDTDGDGLTDYEEMVLMRNPMLKEPLPRNRSEAEIAASKKRAEINFIRSQEDWELRKKEAFARGMRRAANKEKGILGKREQAQVAQMRTLNKKADKARQQAQEKMLKAQKYAEENGYTRELTSNAGRFSGMAGNYPVFVSGSNQVAAASVSIDELWPASAAPWASGSTGLGLTGAGQTLAIWEANSGGGVFTNHTDFGSRVNQQDRAGIDQTSHATHVTGTMVGSGSGNATAKGAAYEAEVEAFNLTNLATERLEAADGTYGTVIVVGNNSWNEQAGWEIRDVSANSSGVFRWVWYGGGEIGDEIDPKFGRYTENDPFFDDGAVNLDEFVNADAPHHLPVYSCGNDRNEGPGDINGFVTNFFFVPFGNGFQARNRFVYPRDYIDGDAGGYDSVATPGTAKNILTVGACLDVTHQENGNTVPGFGNGSVVTPADFLDFSTNPAAIVSGTGFGPTDDGRIKPDLVAVGAGYSPDRDNLGTPSIFPTAGVVTTDRSGGYNGNDTQGTSFSAPAVTGGIGLMLERRKELYYPGVPTPSTDLWLASTLKALAINGCDDPGNPGPDFRMGYGLFNAATSVSQIDEDHDLGRGSQIKEFILDDGESVSWLVSVSSGSRLSVTAAWSDPAGPGLPLDGDPDDQDPVLVNNIDIKMENVDTPGILLPWVLNPDLGGESEVARAAAAFPGVDNRNNVEQISTESPVAGIYRITVTHSGDLPGNPAATAQQISVVSTNAQPLMATVESIEISPVQNEFIVTYLSDPGAHYDIETSVDLQNWTASDTTIAEPGVNTVMVTTQASNPRRFWRLRRSQ